MTAQTVVGSPGVNPTIDYGMDFLMLFNTDGTIDIDPFTVLDNDPLIVAQRVICKVLISRGDHWWDINVGSDLPNARGALFTGSKIASLRERIKEQATSDPQVQSAIADLQFDKTSGILYVRLAMTISGNVTFSANLAINGTKIVVNMVAV